MDEWVKIAEKIATAGDAAVFLLAGTVGYLVGGLEAGVSSGTGALGLKKAFDAIKAKQRERARVELLLKLLGDEPAYQPIALRLRKTLELFDAKIIDADQLKTGVDEAVTAYQEHSRYTAQRLKE